MPGRPAVRAVVQGPAEKPGAQAWPCATEENECDENHRVGHQDDGYERTEHLHDDLLSRRRFAGSVVPPPFLHVDALLSHGLKCHLKLLIYKFFFESFVEGLARRLSWIADVTGSTNPVNHFGLLLSPVSLGGFACLRRKN